MACGAMVCLLAMFCLVAPYAKIPLQAAPAFVPMYATLFIFNELITAILILAQFWVVRWTWLLVLASGYLFVALMAMPGVLAFPGVFSQAGLLGAGPQSAAWIGVLYHVASPAFVIAALLLKDARPTPGVIQRAPGQAIALSAGMVAAAVFGLTWFALAHEDLLPQLFVNSVQQSPHFILVVVPIMMLEASAFLLLWRREKSVLALWLMVVCCAWLLELSLGALFAGARYTLGWYTARAFQLLAAIFVMVLLLSETAALYANMVRAAVQRRGARHARQIAMDAMAASIGHEIKQPLTAIVANAGAGKSLATRTNPDMTEMHAIFSDIAAEGERMGQIISGVRTMFQKSTREQQLLDINKVIRDVLGAIELDLRIHRVNVKTELDDGLAPVFGNEGQLHQLFLNLISNAQEAMSNVVGRTPVLTVRSRTAEGSSQLEITVEDNGIGIAGSDSSRIFQPFFSTKAAGTGVGLTICQVIVEAHGGTLDASPNRPFGTVFRVVLPAGEEEY